MARGGLLTLYGRVPVKRWAGVAQSAAEPGWLRKDFSDYLGVHAVVWLKRGIAGDDTHGHVDDIRLVSRMNGRS